jgi:hypothetical protein
VRSPGEISAERRLAAVVLVSLLAGAAPAADQAILGARLRVRDPDPADVTARRVTAIAREPASSATVVGDPTRAGSVGGAFLELFAGGAHPSAQTFALPQGTSRSGGAFWEPLGKRGYRYRDRDGEQGPVSDLLIARSAGGRFRIKATAAGTSGSLAIVPPAPGTDGHLTLTVAGGERYCVQYGPEGESRNRADRSWAIRRVTAEGCPRSGEFVALTYNVAGLPEGISGSHPATNTPLMSPRLNGYDLVLVQESWQTPDPNPLAPLRVYHELLVADAIHPFKSPSAPLPLGTDPRRPSALVSDGLNHLSRFPFEPPVRVAWDGCHVSAADCLALKGFSVARTTLFSGAAVDVYTLHMEAGGAPEDDALRDAGVTQLATFMNDFSAGRAVIVGGDFNLHTDTEPDRTQFERLLAETGLADVCATLGCPEPERIDKFLFRSAETLVLTPRSWRLETDVFVRDDGEPLSDHDPVAVRFAWSIPGAGP